MGERTGLNKVLKETHMKMLGIPKKYWFAKLDKIPESSFKNTLKIYIEKSGKFLSEGIGLYVEGKPYTGKTYLASVLAKEILRKHYLEDVNIKYITALKLVELVTSDYDDDKELLYYIKYNVDMLIIDDFGYEPTGFSQNIFSIVKNCISNNKAVILVTSKSIIDLQEKYGEVIRGLISINLKDVKISGSWARERKAYIEGEFGC